MQLISSASYIFCKDNNNEVCVLGAKRSGNSMLHYGGLYNVPTGMREANESIEECGQREVYEETGLNIPIDKFKMIGTEEWGPNKVGANFKVILDGCINNYEVGEGDWENDKFQWIPLSQINNYQWMYNMDKTILNVYRTNLNESVIGRLPKSGYLNAWVPFFKGIKGFENLTQEDLNIILKFNGIYPLNGKYSVKSITNLYDELWDEWSIVRSRTLDYYNKCKYPKVQTPQEEDIPEEIHSPEEDMDYVSQELLKQDDVMNENKNIYITESQFNELKNKLNEETLKVKIRSNKPIDPEKVLIIKKYLDKAFKRGSIATIDDNGYPFDLPIVAMLASNGEVMRNMTDVQLFYLLQDRFKNIYSDHNHRDKFLKQLIKDWFYKKISNEGLLSVNMI